MRLHVETPPPPSKPTHPPLLLPRPGSLSQPRPAQAQAQAGGASQGPARGGLQPDLAAPAWHLARLAAEMDDPDMAALAARLLAAAGPFDPAAISVEPGGAQDAGALGALLPAALLQLSGHLFSEDCEVCGGGGRRGGEGGERGTWWGPLLKTRHGLAYACAAACRAPAAAMTAPVPHPGQGSAGSSGGECSAAPLQVVALAQSTSRHLLESEAARKALASLDQQDWPAR
jgi:hypothetical protein